MKPFKPNRPELPKLFGFHVHREYHPWMYAPPWAIELREMVRAVITRLEELDEMATKKTLEELKASVGANTNATHAAAEALGHFATVNEDLAKQLADAIANSSAADDVDVQAAIDAINANNAELAGAVPVVAAAVTANTPAG